MFYVIQQEHFALNPLQHLGTLMQYFCCISLSDLICIDGGIFIKPQKVSRPVRPLPTSLIGLFQLLSKQGG